MPMHLKTSRITTSVPTIIPAKRLALALPFAITVGCAGPDRTIIDYTVSPSEYAALTSPEPEAKEMLATEEPMLAAAKPAVEKLPSLVTDAKAVMLETNQAETLSIPTIAIEEPTTDTTVPTLAIAEPATVTAEPTLAAAIADGRLGFTPSIYTTVGLGVSRSNPDTSADTNFASNDKIEPAGQVSLGLDISRFLSVEAHSADYGSTSLSPEGRINTIVNGVSALIYAGRRLDRFRRQGLNAYARIGFNRIETSPVGNIPFLERTSSQASFGLGAEYTTRFGLGLRADVIAYDSDVQYGQFGVLYRLASKPNILPKLAKATPETVLEPQLLPEPLPELKAALPTVTDTKPSMEKAIQTNAVEPTQVQDFASLSYATEHTTSDDACTGLNGTLSNVNFKRGSARLTHNAFNELNNVATTLNDCGNRQIIVSAHTDNTGLAADNDALSKRRARAVVVHLVTRGVDRNRMRAVAYGESQPVASNSTPEGRTQNRRVELEVR